MLARQRQFKANNERANLTDSLYIWIHSILSHLEKPSHRMPEYDVTSLSKGVRL